MHVQSTRRVVIDPTTAYATIVVLDAERRTCPHCGPDGLCDPLLLQFGRAIDVIVAGGRDQAVAA